MKTQLTFARSATISWHVLIAAALALPLLPAAAADKVHIQVEVVSAKASAGEKSTTKPAAEKGKPATPAPKSAAPDMYTHSSSKALTVSVSNGTKEDLGELSVKVAFLAKAEPKHDVVTAKDHEQKVTLAAGKAEKFTTPEVTFAHTSAHRPPAVKGAKPGTKAPAMEPASGQSFSGWKVEVFQGSTLVGSATGQSN